MWKSRCTVLMCWCFFISSDVSVCCVSKSSCMFETYRTVKSLKRKESQYFTISFVLGTAFSANGKSCVYSKGKIKVKKD